MHLPWRKCLNPKEYLEYEEFHAPCHRMRGKSGAKGSHPPQGHIIPNMGSERG